VASYRDSSDYPDRGRLAAETGLPNNQLHVKIGAPEDVINEVASDIDADLVILAVSPRKDLKTALMGRKMDKIIKTINRDMSLVV
jgi:universal stress protein E